MYQMVSLLQCGDGAVASKVLRKRRVKDLVVQVEALYLPWKDCSSSALGAKPAAAGAAAAGVGGTVGSAVPALEVGVVGDVGGGGETGEPPSPSCE